MKISITHECKEEYLPPRCRKPRTRIIKPSFDLTIKEITSDEAPVAMITTTLEWRKVEGGVVKGTDLIPVDTEYRWYKRKLYTAFIDRSGDAKTLADVERRISVYDNWNHTQDEIEQSLNEAIKSFIYVDGILHILAGEPRYVINTFGLGRNHGGTGFFVENHYNSNISKDRYFNALQRDEAIAYGKKIASGRGDTKSVDRIGETCNIRVLIPKAVKCKQNKEHGKGCEFINTVESLISDSNSVLEAGLLTVAAGISELNKVGG